MDFTEADLAAVGKIQELKSCTVEQAKQVYRQHALKLANPDNPDRAELVLTAVSRGAEAASDDEVEAAVMKKPKMGKNERRLARHAKQKEKAVKKPAKAKKTAPKKETSKRPDIALVPLSRDVELTEVAKYVYTANLFGKKHAVVLIEHDCSAAAGRFAPIDVRKTRFLLAAQHARENSLPIAICAIKRVSKKLDQGYAVPMALYNQFKNKNGFLALSGEAREAYAANGWAGCKFVIKSAEAKAA
jgi:hypothetical protein